MVSQEQLSQWLRDVQRGRRRLGEVVRVLGRRPVEDLGFARLDVHRHLRRGIPEAILCEGKTPVQIIGLTRRMIVLKQLVLLTRLAAEPALRVQTALPAVRYDPVARLGYWAPRHGARRRGLAVVVSAGTADLPVAAEAALTLQLLGSRTESVHDVGVAGLHRLLSSMDVLQRARVIVAVAGMEGALPSVVAGLVRGPVVAVPTSVGYGASFGGLAALLAMMNSCAPGVAVVNIDNGYGAGYLAHVINTGGRPGAA